MKYLSLFSAIALIVSFGITAASARVYECELTGHSPAGWIPSKLLLSVDEEIEAAMVLDGMIQELVGAPVPAEFKRRDKTSIKLNWRVKGIPLGNRRQKVDASFGAILHTNTGKITVTVYLKGSDMIPPNGSGTCKTIR